MYWLSESFARYLNTRKTKWLILLMTLLMSELSRCVSGCKMIFIFASAIFVLLF
jgi:hypothetical protein